MTFCKAINHTLDMALGNDERVFLMGEDIADPAGGVVKATFGLSTKYGSTGSGPHRLPSRPLLGPLSELR